MASTATMSPGRAAARRAGAAPDEEKQEQVPLEKAFAAIQQEVDELGAGRTQAQSALKTLRSLVSGEDTAPSSPGRAFNGASSPGMRAAGK
jgi:hypothetical protein